MVILVLLFWGVASRPLCISSVLKDPTVGMKTSLFLLRLGLIKLFQASVKVNISTRALLTMCFGVTGERRERVRNLSNMLWLNLHRLVQKYILDTRSNMFRVRYCTVIENIIGGTFVILIAEKLRLVCQWLVLMRCYYLWVRWSLINSDISRTL